MAIDAVGACTHARAVGRGGGRGPAAIPAGRRGEREDAMGRQVRASVSLADGRGRELASCSFVACTLGRSLAHLKLQALVLCQLPNVWPIQIQREFASLVLSQICS